VRSLPELKGMGGAEEYSEKRQDRNGLGEQHGLGHFFDRARSREFPHLVFFILRQEEQDKNTIESGWRLTSLKAVHGRQDPSRTFWSLRSTRYIPGENSREPRVGLGLG